MKFLTLLTLIATIGISIKAHDHKDKKNETSSNLTEANISTSLNQHNISADDSSALEKNHNDSKHGHNGDINSTNKINGNKSDHKNLNSTDGHRHHRTDNSTSANISAFKANHTRKDQKSDEKTPKKNSNDST